MQSLYEVFDNVQVQLMTRRQAAKLTALAVTVVSVSVLAFILPQLIGIPFVVVLAAVLTGWALTFLWCAGRYRRLRSVVWCVKLSDREIVGYDFARRKTRVDWLDVERVELGTTSLVVVGPSSFRLEVSHVFPDFADLSHRIIHYAEFYEIPVFIDGGPWQLLDVYDLYPFLATSGAARGSV
jgi:hypothetical protein